MASNINTDKFGVPDDQVSGYSGDQFKQAREAKGLSQDQAAQDLRLPKTVIQSLESGNFSASKGQVFDRGYIRAYARYLNISAEDLLNGYTLLMGNDSYTAQPNALEVKSAVAKNQLKDPWIIGITVVVVIILLSIFAWWWNTQNTPMETAQIETVTVQDSQGVDQVELLSEAVDIVAETPNQFDQTFDNSAAAVDNWTELNNLSFDDKQTDSLLVLDNDTNNANAGDALAITNEQDLTLSEDFFQPDGNDENISDFNISTNNEPDFTTSQVDSSLSNLTDLDDVINEQPALLDGNALRIVFSEDCWVEITDSDGKKVLVGIFSAGRTVEVPVKAPASVLLGRSSGVAEFNYNGEEIDLEPYTRKDVARFTLEI